MFATFRRIHFTANCLHCAKTSNVMLQYAPSAILFLLRYTKKAKVLFIAHSATSKQHSILFKDICVSVGILRFGIKTCHIPTGIKVYMYDELFLSLKKANLNEKYGIYKIEFP